MWLLCAIIRYSDLNQRNMFTYERNFKHLFTIITTGELTNNTWYKYHKCFAFHDILMVYIYIAHAQKHHPLFLTPANM